MEPFDDEPETAEEKAISAASSKLDEALDILRAAGIDDPELCLAEMLG